MGSEQQLDDDFEEVMDSSEQEQDVPTELGVNNNLDARRRLEERLEQRRLERELNDLEYDFDD